MNPIIQDILASMDSAACNIQQDAMHKGFEGNEQDAVVVKQFFGNYSMDTESYALLYANSAVIQEGFALVKKHGSDTDKAIAAELKLFDYNA